MAMFSQAFLVAVALISQTKPGAEAPWQTFTPETGEFQISLPARPTERKRTIEVAGKKVELVGYTVLRRTYSYGVTVGELSKVPGDSRALLKELRDDAVKQVRGTLQDESPINWNGHPGRALVIDVPKTAFAGGARAQVHVYLVGQRVYEVTAVVSHSLGQVDTEPFFASFQPQVAPKQGIASSKPEGSH
jgi:hypothetical protein